MSVERWELAPGYSISRIINGGWQLSAGHRRDGIDPDAAVDALLRLRDAGLTTFDCADIYTGVEELFGRFLRRYRERGGDPGLEGVQIHTKYVPDLADLPRLARRDVERSIDRSLLRLGVDRLDLVQFHWWDYGVPGYVEAAGWLDELRRAGKIRLLGATNFDVPRLAEILGAGIGMVSNQVQYSLLDQRPGHRMADLCAEQGVVLLCYGTLAGGFLSERYRGRPEPEGELANRSLTKYRLIIEEAGGWPHLQRLLEAAHGVAERHGVSLSNVATRWVLDQPRVAAVLVGAPDDRHLEDNVRALGLDLDRDDEGLLRRILEQGNPLLGDAFSIERVRGGPHSNLMKTDLHRQDGGGAMADRPRPT